jgi:hypothetical protein
VFSQRVKASPAAWRRDHGRGIAVPVEPLRKRGLSRLSAKQEKL